jgi:sugar O-acyltransferase (sialic acid O-acetyltransferase NeuD family)
MILSQVDLLIIGIGGNSLEVQQRLVERHPNWAIRFLDDSSNHPLVVGKLAKVTEAEETKKLFLIGSTKSFRRRQELFDRLEIPENQLFTFLDENSRISPTASVGAGCAVMWNTYVGDSCKLGQNLIILPNVFIGHNSIVGNFTVIAANAAISGSVNIGKQCYIGSNSTIREGVTIGDNTLIGAGSVVVTDVPSDSTFVGNPARLLRK